MNQDIKNKIDINSQETINKIVKNPKESDNGKLIEEVKKIFEENGYKFRKVIGQGGFGAVVEVEKDGRIFANKIMKSNSGNEIRPEMVREFRGRNLVKIFQEKTKDDKYYFYVMERSFIGSLSDIHDYLNSNLIFKEAFVENFGDNLTRFFVSQMVNAFRTFFQGNLIHFDIKPDNMLIFKGLEIKIIDFSFLKKLSPDKVGRIPGGTFGYESPDYFKICEYNYDTLQKQDYYALGMTIYFLKYGISPMQDFRQGGSLDSYTIRSNITYEAIEKARQIIKCQKYQDKDFTEFLFNLIQFKSNDRLNFEEIKRNKWLNKNTNIIKKIKYMNLTDEDSIILELQKSDFIVNNTKSYRYHFNERYKNDNDNKKYKQVRKGKFKFGKRS